MPLPRPNPQERRKAFLARFMAEDAMRREYADLKQRYAVANQQWRRRKTKKE